MPMEERVRTYKYKAFMSYSHKADRLFAPQLQHALETLAKPWYRRRAIDLFRDETDLAVNPDLWPRIVDAMDECEHMLLLGTPEAAQSPWVGKELEYWRAHRGTTSIAIALTGGEIAWDKNDKDFDWHLTNAIPERMAGAFATEPLWADFRSVKADRAHAAAFRESAVRLCAGLRGVAPRDLESEDLRQHRRTIRVFGGIIAVLIVLAIAVIVAAIYAFAQRDVAEARELAAQADLLVNETDASSERATLLALESLKKKELPDNRRVLGQTLPVLLPFVSTLPPEKVAAAAFSPDGRHVAIASEDGTLSVFDASKWKAIATAKLKLARTLSTVAFSLNSQWIAVGDDEGTIVVSALRGTEAYRFSLGDGVKSLSFGSRGNLLGAVSVEGRIALADATGHQASLGPFSRQAVNAFAFSDDDRRIALAQYRAVRLVEAATGENVWTWTVPGDVNVVAFNPGGEYVAVGWGDSVEGGCALLDSRTGQPVWRQPRNGGIVVLRFTSDGSKLAFGGWDDEAVVFDLRSRTAVSGLSLGDAVRDLAFTPDGSHLAVAGRDGTTRVLDVKRGVEVARLEHGGVSVWFDRDGQSLITVGNDRRVYVFSVGGAMEVSRITLSGPVYAAMFGARGTHLALGSEEGVRLFDTASGRPLPRIGPDDKAESIAFSADDQYLAAGYFGHARVFETASGRQLADVPHEGHVTAVALSGDGRYLATEGSSDPPRLFVVSRGVRAAEINLNSLPVGAVALSADGRLFAAAGDDGDVHLVSIGANLAGVSPPKVISRGATPSAIAFSPDARYIAVGDWGNNVRILDIETGRVVYEWLHAQPIRALSFSRNGDYVITASQPDQPLRSSLAVTTRVFSMSDGGEWARVSAMTRFGAASLDAGGTALLTATSIFGSGVISVDRHPLLARELLMIGCSRVSRNLTCVEWKRYRHGARYEPTCPNLPAAPCP